MKRSGLNLTMVLIFSFLGGGYEMHSWTSWFCEGHKGFHLAECWRRTRTHFLSLTRANNLAAANQYIDENWIKSVKSLAQRANKGMVGEPLE